MFCALKSLVKSKSKTRRKVLFLLYPAYFSLLFLFHVATFQLNNVQYFFHYMHSKRFTTYLSLTTKRIKVANIATFLFFACQIYLFVVVI